MEMPKGQGGKLEPSMAVAMAVGGQLPGQQTLLYLSRQAGKIDSVEWHGDLVPHLSLPGEETYDFVHWINSSSLLWVRIDT